MATYLDMANAAAVQNGIPPNLFAAQIGVESGWNPNAVGTSGELGLAQVMPSTGADMGYTTSQLSTASGSLQAGAQYLAQQFQRFGNWVQALAAYNAGPGNVNSTAGNTYAQKVIANASGFDLFDPSTWGVNAKGGFYDLNSKSNSLDPSIRNANKTFSWADPSTWWPEIMRGLKAMGIPIAFFVLAVLLILAGIFSAIRKG